MTRRRHEAGDWAAKSGHGCAGAGWRRIAVFGILLLGGASGVRAADSSRNACGCYANDVGTCYCDRKAKCGCPGECEPKGCEEQRQRQLDKEIQAETRRAQQVERASESASGNEHPAPTPARLKAPASGAPTHAPRLSPAQQHELARLLELYVAEDPARRAMRADDVVKALDVPRRNTAHP